ncbi:MAG: hypothetical protein QM766_25925 [Burkholderiaceae bacterium]
MAEPLNALRLVAVLEQRGLVRYTPAGLPMLDAMLHHQSQQSQQSAFGAPGTRPAGPRAVDFRLAAVFPGAVAARADALPVGALLDVSGYLASRRLASRSLVLHVTDFSLIETDPREQDGTGPAI